MNNIIRILAAPSLTVILTTPASAQMLSMQRDDYASAGGARGITVADFNRDGWLDIATANNEPDGVAILLNRGVSGGYTQSFISLPGGPFAIASGDLNNDGVPDLAIANADANLINVLFGRSGGGFRAPVNIGVQFNPRGLTLADIDKDGNLDVIYTLYNNQGVQIRYGDGRGNFVVRAGPAMVGINPQGVAVADFNVDGWPDLVVAATASVGLSVLYQTPDGTGRFSRKDLNVPRSQNVVAVGDLNHDGRPDIAAASTATSDITIFVNGRGSTSTVVYPSGGTSPRGLVVEDLNRDGALDVITGNRGSNTVQVLPGNGNGEFGAPFAFAAGTGSRTVAVGDLDADGRVDIASGNEYGRGATVLSNVTDFPRAAFAFKRVVLGSTGTGFYGPSTAAVADFDVDGKPDVVTHGARGGAVVLFGNGRSTTLATSMYLPADVAAGYANSDAFPDILLLDHATGGARARIAAYLSDGAGNFPGRATTQTSLFANELHEADLNHDGRTDVVIVGRTENSGATGPFIQAFLGNGAGGFSLIATLALPRTATSAELGDVDRDGDIDIVAYTNAFTAGSTIVYTWPNDGAGNFDAARETSVPGCDGIYGAALGDVNRDGFLDYVARCTTPTYETPMILLLGDPSGFVSPTFLSMPGSGGSGLPTIVDINLDGSADIVSTEGTVLPGRGDGTFDEPVGFDFYVPSMRIVDFDGNGLPDIVGSDELGAAQIILNQRRDTNLPPTISLGEDFAIGYEWQFGDGYELDLWAQGADPDLHRLTFVWTDATGRRYNTGSDPTLSRGVLNPGRHEYFIEASDGRGGIARDSVVITVRPLKEIVMHVAWPNYAPGWTQGNWQVIDDATAASGAALHDVNAGKPKVTTPVANPSSYAEHTFVADPTQTYKLWVRLKADGNTWVNDSVWLQFSDAVDASGRTYAPETTSGIAVVLEECSGCGESGWGWRDEAWGRRGAVGTLTLRFPNGGFQRLRLQTREDGVNVDQVVLSAEKYRAVRPGTVKNDGTILPIN